MDAAPPSPPAPLKTPWAEVLAAAAIAVAHALVVTGRLHPDEVYQSLEPALHKAFGYGVLSWEWTAPPEGARDAQPWGIRNWAVPTLFAWVLQAAHALGFDSVWGRRAAIALPQWALHAAMLGAVWRFSARRVGPRLARASLWLTAVYAPVVWFGGRTMSESFSVAFLVWGLERLDDRAGARWSQPVFAGLLLGCAQVARYGSAAVIAPALLWLLVTRRWRSAALTAAGGLVVALGLGVLDLVTWGAWFHSMRAYVDFNVLSGRAAQSFGEMGWWWYGPRLAVAPWAVLGLVLWRWSPAARSGLLLAAGVGYLAAISATAHKEERFLYPTLVLLTVAGTPAFVEWAWRRRGALVARALAPLALAGGLALYVAPSPFAPQREAQFQLQRLASADATGFILMNEGVWGAGGFFYVGGEKPWCTCDFPGDPCFETTRREPRINRALYWSNADPREGTRDQDAIAAFEAIGFRVLERRGQATLLGR